MVTATKRKPVAPKTTAAKKVAATKKAPAAAGSTTAKTSAGTPSKPAGATADKVEAPAKATSTRKPSVKAVSATPTPGKSRSGRVPGGKKGIYGYTEGTTLDLAAHAAVAGGTDRQAVLEALRAADTDNITASGKVRNWSVALSTVTKGLLEAGGSIDSHWSIVPGEPATPAKSTPRAVKAAKKAATAAPAASVKKAPARKTKGTAAVVDTPVPDAEPEAPVEAKPEATKPVPAKKKPVASRRKPAASKA